MSALAIRYNDRSVLEMMHAAKTFEIMHKEGCNWLSTLTSTEHDATDYSRKLLLRMILGTDMTLHTKHVEKLAELATKHELIEPGDLLVFPAEFRKAVLEDKHCELEATLHAADLSAMTKKRPLMFKWSKRILNEFWVQGDEERKRGMEISPCCNREDETRKICGGQVFFARQIVLPLWKQLNHLLPDLAEALQQCAENADLWDAISSDCTSLDDVWGTDELS